MFIVARGCAALVTWGCAPNPRRPLAGTPSPRSAAAGPRRARPGGRTPPCCRPPPYFTVGGFFLLLQLGAAPQTPAGHSRGPLRPTPWPAGHAVRGLGTAASTFAVPFLVTWGCAPNPRRPLAGTPSPRSVAGGPRRARPGHGSVHVCRPLPCSTVGAGFNRGGWLVRPCQGCWRRIQPTASSRLSTTGGRATPPGGSAS